MPRLTSLATYWRNTRQMPSLIRMLCQGFMIVSPLMVVLITIANGQLEREWYGALVLAILEIGIRTSTYDWLSPHDFRLLGCRGSQSELSLGSRVQRIRSDGDTARGRPALGGICCH
jgi:hypothetical protein